MNDQQPTAERAAFEKWWMSGPYPRRPIDRFDDKCVTEDEVWEVWQAALAQRKPMIEDQALPSQLARRAQREPVVDGEVAATWNRLDADGYHAERDILQRTEAARVATETKASIAEEQAVLAVNKARELIAQLTAERERSAKLAEAAKTVVTWLDWSGGLPELGGESMTRDIQSLREALAAYQSSKENRHA